MTTAPAARPPMTVPARAPGASPAPSGMPAVTLDPIKLIKKYLWVLVGAGIFGAILGVVIYIVMSRVAPSFRSFAMFEARVPKVDMGQAPGTERLDEDEMARFIGSQVSLMRSDAILEAVAQNPRLVTDAPRYASKFMIGGVPDTQAIRKDLKTRVSARALPDTYFIELACSYRNPQEATVLTGLVKTAYIRQLQTQANREANQQKDIIKRTISDAESQIASLQARRERLVQEGNFDTLDDRSTDVAQTLSRVTNELVELQLAIEATRVQLGRYEAQLNSPTGVTYDDELIAIAERDPRIQRARGQLDDLQTSLRTLRESGFSDEHRDVVNIQSAIRAAEARMEESRQTVYRQQFEGQVESTRRTIAQLDAQRADLESEREKARQSRNELTRLATTVDDLSRRIGEFEAQRTSYETDLKNLEALSSRDAANRIVELFPERVPDERSSPKIKVVGPATVFLVMGLVSGLIVLRELLDQRVKTPADVAMIPRTRIVGVIPSSGEDPTKAKQIETVFRDEPRGVLAESFRQLRGQITKRLAAVESPAVVFIPCSPGSGATTMVANSALAFAASDVRTLVIDANFRRPRLDSVFGLPAGAGLGDVLKGTATLESAVHTGVQPNLDVLTAGSPELRVFELLSTGAMAALIARAKTEYDMILIDAPPALVAGDGAMMANRADASILVARAMNEKRGMVARLKNEISESRGEFLGVVVNDVRAAAGGYMKRNIKLTHRYHSEQDDASANTSPPRRKPKAPSKGATKDRDEADDLIPDKQP